MDTDTSQPAFRRHEIAPLLAAILRVVSSTLDERAIGQTVVDEAVKLLHADRSAIYFLDDRRETLLRFVAVDARDPSTVDTLFYPNSVPVTAQPIFGAALARPEPIAVVDTYDDPRTTRAFFEQFDTRALLLAPLLARAQRLLGFLGFFWVGRPRQLGDDHLALADALGRQAAIAFENARLYRAERESARDAERERQRQELLNQASAVFSSSMQQQQVLDRVTRMVCEALGDSATITLRDGDGQVRVVSAFQRDPAYRALRATLDSSAAFTANPELLRVYQTGQPTLANQHDSGRRSDPALRLASFILVPLVAQGRTFGTLGVSSTLDSPRSYDAADLRTIQALADRAALAIENARLFAESERSRRQAEAQSRDLAAIFRDVPAGLALYDTSPDFRCVRHNAGFLQLVGQEWQARGSIAGLPLRDLFDDDSYQTTRQVFETALATGEVFMIDEYPAVLLPDPRPRYYKWSLTPLKDGHAQVTGLLVSAIEITEQVRARERVGELARLAADKTAQLQLIIESIADGVWVCDAQGRVVEVNQRAIDLVGLPEKETNLRPLDDYERLIGTRHPDGAPMSRGEFPLIRALEGQPVVSEALIRNVGTGRDTWLQISAAPLFDDSGQVTGAVAVGRDITASAELTRQKAEFLSMVAHELKTPITVIKGLSQAMERRYQQRLERYAPDDLFSASELQKYAGQLGTVVWQTVRLDRLVADLLDLTRLEGSGAPANYRRLNLAGLLSDVVERFQSAIMTHQIAVAIGAPDAYVEVDEERIEHVIVNLLQNAAKYSPAGAPIDVALAVDSAEVTVAVRDYGIGIPDGEQSRLFSRFFRASNAPAQRYGGIGLGLYLSAEIVKRHGGRMAVDSREGTGSTFSFTLPLSEL